MNGAKQCELVCCNKGETCRFSKYASFGIASGARHSRSLSTALGVYFTGIFYAVVRQFFMFFIDNKISVFCILYHSDVFWWKVVGGGGSCYPRASSSRRSTSDLAGETS